METVWGFDLGVSSVGFAVLRWDGWKSDDGKGDILALGVRTFPETRDEKSKEPRNVARRQKRLMRRQIRRRRWRRIHLRALLAEAGLLPDRNAQPPQGQDPYALRARGLSEPLRAEEAGWAIFHLLKRRGFLGSRKHDPAQVEQITQEAPRTRGQRAKTRQTDSTVASSTSEDRDQQEREAEEQGKKLAAKLAGRPLALYLQSEEHLRPNGPHTPGWDLAPRRGVGQTRSMVREEFEALWAEQARHHPHLFTPELKARIETVALSQRPTFFRARSFGEDDFEPGEPRAIKAHWLVQRFETLQLVNALRLEGGNQRRLDAEERAKALDYLERVVTPSWAGLRKAIGLSPTDRFTHERGAKETIRGNATEAALRAALGETWDHLDPGTRDTIRQEIGPAWHRIEYRPVKGGGILEIRDWQGIAEERAKLAARAQQEWGLSPKEAERLAAISLPDGTARHSLKAIKRLLPHLEQGLTYMEAVEREYGTRRDSTAPLSALPGPNPGELRNITDPVVRERMRALLAGIRNPTVLRTLGELQKVVNTLLRVYGRPDVIRLEFARGLKEGAKQRAEADRAQANRERLRKKAREEVRKLGKPAEGPDGEEYVLRWLLWQEQGGRSPYSGEMIGASEALDAAATQIDHIFPVSRSFDDSQANKVLVLAQENIAKGRRTPYEWLANTDRWTHLTQVVWPKMVEGGWPEAKRRRCLKAVLEDLDAGEEGFTARQLVDTAYIARAARDYLGLLFGGGQAGWNAVQPVSGRATALLRRAWGVGLGKLLGSGDEAEKIRDDLRHHAVDALVVALTEPRTIQALSRWWQVRETGVRPPQFPIPWPGFREEAKEKVASILVSHRVQAKLSGQLHAEKPFGCRKIPNKNQGIGLVQRKVLSELNENEIERIVDPVIRNIVKNAIKDGDSLEKIANQGLRMPRKDGSPGPLIKKVRIFGKNQNIQLALPGRPKPKTFYTGLALHHIALYAKDNQCVVRVRQLHEVATWNKQGLPIVPKKEGNLPIQFVLYPGDIIAKIDNGNNIFARIVKFASDGRVVLREHQLANNDKDKYKTLSVLWREGWRKVAVDPIGRWRFAT